MKFAFGGKYKPIFLVDNSPIHKWVLKYCVVKNWPNKNIFYAKRGQKLRIYKGAYYHEQWDYFGYFQTILWPFVTLKLNVGYHIFGRVIFWFPFHLILPYAVFYNSEFIRTRPDDALNAKTMNVRGNRSFFFVTVFLSWMAWWYGCILWRIANHSYRWGQTTPDAAWVLLQGQP